MPRTQQRKVKTGLNVRLPDETRVPKLPSRSPFKDAHHRKLYHALRRSPTVGDFRQTVRDKGLYRNLADARFCNVLYAMVQEAVSR
jgi:hypothetical protein